MAAELPYTVRVLLTEPTGKQSHAHHLAHKVIVTANGDLLIQKIEEPTPGVGYAKGTWTSYCKVNETEVVDEEPDKTKSKKSTSND
jgi:hypothetical protein